MLLDDLTEIARTAGAVLMPYYGDLGVAQARAKGDRRRDLVSAADLAAERAILERIPAGDSVLAEESGARAGGGRHWLVDPLDGTINFLHALPFWCVSLAVVDEGELCAGVVHAPALDLTFAAAVGEGARVNGQPSAVSTAEHLEDAIVATGFPYARDTLADNNLDNIPRVGAVVGGLRRMGSAALDLALVAAGRLDAFWELHLNAWDVAAGVLLVRESGGTVTDFHGQRELDRLLYGRHIVASNGRVHEALRGRLAPLRELD